MAKDYTTPSEHPASGGSKRWKLVSAGLLLLSLVFLIVIIVLGVKLNSKPAEASSGSVKETKSCRRESPGIKLTRKSSGIFEDLRRDEIKRVRDYMLAQKTLDLTPYEKATVADNYIYFIKLYLPNKADVLRYLDENGPKPERNAQVSLFMGKENKVREFIVGPVSSPSRHNEHRVPGQRYPIPFNARPFDDIIELAAVQKLVHRVTSLLRALFLESYDGYTNDDCGEKCLTIIYSVPMGTTSETRVNWFWFTRTVPGHYEFPIDFELYIQHEGSNVSNWNVEKIVYNDQKFDSAEDLLNAYKSDSLNKSFFAAPIGESKDFASYKRRGKPKPQVPLRGPEQYQPDGQRYAVDDRRIEYMGWEFEFGNDPSYGLAAYDIRFNGERVVYELSLQEAVATYGGYFPSQTSMNFLDASWRLGRSSYELVRGVDCPGHATFFDLTNFIGTGEEETMRNAVCVFELNTGIPLRRHYDNDFAGSYKFYGGMVNTALVMRTVSTVYNYDYIWDLIFYQNGVIEVKISASGYVMGSLYTDEVKNYAYKLYKQLTSATHDHLLNIKVDLDVAGIKNSYETIEIGIENVTSKWEDNQRRVRKVLKRSTKSTEKDALYKFDFDHPKYLNFYSEKENRNGVKRGYRIQHAGIMKQLYPEDWMIVPMVSWSLYQLAVTRYNESERRSSSIYNQNSPTDTQVDFRNFVSDESIVNQDLVAWVTMGMIHVPHSEDLPNTGTVGSSASFFIRPFNYFDEDPSIASSDAILITPSDKEASGQKIDRFGTPEGPVCVPAEYSINFSGRYAKED
ncbi:amiloride-sensitive amine oxidase [copper-containing] [Nematostella vectensis]|uniref:amiloride-sensitive amine oxidase [copper-containing] n=1 Tax=Nematostella vectensis TaxID=45351 RepID=UPI0020777822|nr:amiloride-sensitive amine oxidase [copper-containing] [Nematostella vectensis]